MFSGKKFIAAVKAVSASLLPLIYAVVEETLALCLVFTLPV